jgi:hypothetical protein
VFWVVMKDSSGSVALWRTGFSLPGCLHADL